MLFKRSFETSRFRKRLDESCLANAAGSDDRDEFVHGVYVVTC